MLTTPWKRLYISCTPAFTYMQGLVLCILKMNGMLKMQSASFTTTVLRNARYQLNGGDRHGDGSYQKPTKTLFVCNFDPFRTKEVDIVEHFQPYGKVINVRMRSNYLFAQFATQEDATKAFEATQRSQILGKVIAVEYGLKDDDERDDRRGGGSPKRSPSPAYHRRPIPDYGRPRSPEYDRGRSPAAYVRGRRSPSAYDRRRRSPSAYDRRRSPSAYDRRGRSPSAYERSKSPAACERRMSPADYGHRSPDNGRQRSPSYDRYRSLSPVPRGRKAEEYEKNAEPEATKNACDTMSENTTITCVPDDCYGTSLTMILYRIGVEILCLRFL
ncbi:hypothetical protein F2Q69_00062407 [Brassica cretica]|uniref:RRM domain-containing protein n=1 Tax=Brassica cretica TaxID=69181 RepID=A0A8S9RKF8_BRACR|nr:hypothetical protein F2Q69_00062407 [Brassica cretica]